MEHKIQLADKWNTALCEAYGVDPGRVRQVVIVGTAGEAIRVYFDCYGDTRLFGLVAGLPDPEFVELHAPPVDKIGTVQPRRPWGMRRRG